MYQLDGKVAIVTGAGRHKGLGQGIAARLAKEGARVVIADLGKPQAHMPESSIGTTEEMEEIAAEIRSAGGEAMTAVCDVRDEDQVEAMVAAAVAEWGQLDFMVNNAGIGYIIHGVTELSKAEWQAVLDVNLMGAFLCTKHAARQMIAQGNGGRIVNVASQAAKSGFPHMAAYVASKHGMVGLTRSNAIDLAEHGITVNAVCPNHVTTGLGALQNDYFSKMRGQSMDEFMAAMRDRIPLGRPGRVDDIARATAFLCSDEASYITGEAMNVSGGEEMH
jgi:meso-butanediol dehydrogenase/(S,S)-butanediol dehydrogenase/diacetyl reductase